MELIRIGQYVRAAAVQDEPQAIRHLFLPIAV
jgi:hypothetical protein